ncbi:MAG: hypothetical protein L6Q92_05950 [Phycisphaerae bacterium]|nr:hypothetical protein [Phycisphaerae bacterium]
MSGIGEAAGGADSGGDAFEVRMAEFYASVDRAIESRGAVCINRGSCCRFREFGHSLYVTEVERRYFLKRQSVDGLRSVVSDEACPYQVGGACTARAHRPLGCRVYFCDPTSRDWQGLQYETGLAELKAIGEAFGIPYRYREWLTALRGD